MYRRRQSLPSEQLPNIFLLKPILLREKHREALGKIRGIKKGNRCRLPFFSFQDNYNLSYLTINLSE